MQTSNFEKLYSDFRLFFDICRYSDESFKDEIMKRAIDDNITEGRLLFRFRFVIFKFEILNGNIEYLGYEK